MLDGFHDILFGWRFMRDEAREILDKAQEAYNRAKSFVGRVTSAVSEKITRFASDVH